MVSLLSSQRPLVLFMGTGYDKKPWVPRGEGGEAREAFEQRNSREVLPEGITISSQGYKERLYRFAGRRRDEKSLCYFLLWNLQNFYPNEFQDAQTHEEVQTLPEQWSPD